MPTTTLSSPYVSALQTFYNTFAKGYNATTKSIHSGGPERLVAAAGPAIAPGASVLDLATGTGKVALVAAEKVGPHGRVLGIDISDAFLGIAATSAKDAGVGDRVQFLQRNVETLALPEEYGKGWADAVTCGSSIAMFARPKALLETLALDVLKVGGVFVADAWGPHFPAKLFLDVAVPRGFESQIDPLWLGDSEKAFKRVFEGTRFELLKVETEGVNNARWDAGSKEKVEELWKSLAFDQTWLSFGLDRLDAEKVEEIKKAWVEKIDEVKDEEGFVTKDMKQRIAVAVFKG